MKIAVDTETELIRPGLAAPPMSCTTWADEQLNSGLWHVRDSKAHWVKWLEDGGCHLYGLNWAYDTAVACAQWSDLFVPICEAYLDHRMHDVGIDQRLIDIANGELDGRWLPNPDYDPSKPTRKGNKPLKWRKNKYALSELASRLWGEYMRKGEDTWRLRYGSLIPVYPASAWPADAQHYAILDAVNTMKVHLHQQTQEIACGYSVDDVRVNSGAQAQTAFALHLQSCRGIRTDAASCQALIAATEVEIKRCRDLCAGELRDYDYPDTFRPLIEKQTTGKDKGKWTKKRDPAIEHMLGALLRSAGVPDDADWREWLSAQVVAKVATLDDIPKKNASVDITWADEEGETSINVKITEGGDFRLDAEACKDVNDPILRAYATYTSASTMRTKTKRMLRGATIPLQTRYRLPMESGRTSSCSSSAPLVGDNFQNFRRNAMANELGEVLPGQRECIIPREGYDLGSIDLDNAELRCDAQDSIWRVGYSNLADALNRGEDAHLSLAADHLLSTPLTYEEALRRYKAKDPEVDNARQFGKIPNFALDGGARAQTQIPYAKAMGIILTPERADQLYAAFHAKWTEVKLKHNMVRRALRAGGGQYMSEQQVSKRLRLITKYTVGCNDAFQPLMADGATSFLLWLALECYTGREYAIGADGWRIRPTGRASPLEGSYPVLFCHDEVIFEFLRSSHQHEAAYRARDIMVQGFNRYTPDVPMTAEPCLMPFWAKGAKTVHNTEGRLIVWQPKTKTVVLAA